MPSVKTLKIRRVEKKRETQARKPCTEKCRVCMLLSSSVLIFLQEEKIIFSGTGFKANKETSPMDRGGKLNFLRKARWSPYPAGVLLGVVTCFALLTSGKYLGVSTTFGRTTGMIESLFPSGDVASLPYFLKEKPIVDWQWIEVAGILIGAFLAARLARADQARFTPPMWERRFGPSKMRRWGAAFPGGVLIMFGARLADG